jgi:hypothetical protein
LRTHFTTSSCRRTSKPGAHSLGCKVITLHGGTMLSPIPAVFSVLSSQATCVHPNGFGADGVIPSSRLPITYRWLGKGTMVIGALVTMVFFFCYTQVRSDAENLGFNCAISFCLVRLTKGDSKWDIALTSHRIFITGPCTHTLQKCFHRHTVELETVSLLVLIASWEYCPQLLLQSLMYVAILLNSYSKSLINSTLDFYTCTYIHMRSIVHCDGDHISFVPIWALWLSKFMIPHALIGCSLLFGIFPRIVKFILLYTIDLFWRWYIERLLTLLRLACLGAKSYFSHGFVRLNFDFLAHLGNQGGFIGSVQNMARNLSTVSRRGSGERCKDLVVICFRCSDQRLANVICKV